MAKDPAFLFYPSDFNMGTMFMSNEQVGIYIRLLCAQHQHGGLIDKASFNATVNGSEIIRSKFVEAEDGFFNERLMHEMILRKQKSINLTANAVKRWERHNQMKCKSNAIVCDLDMPIEDVNVIKELKVLDITNNKIVNNYNSKIFAEIWAKYPKRVGRKAAEKYFIASVKTVEDENDIKKAIENYLNSKRVMNGYIQNGSTWFNNWRDWIDFEEKVCPKCNDKGVFISSTGYQITCECSAGKRK
jgi:uncharacterized protein YdaU (DUF1376 family)